MTDVGSTKRKPLTPTQRLKMFEAHKGVCCICKVQIITGEKWIDEHIRPLALGGGNEPENRAPAHAKCAAEKTLADMAQITKAKAQKRAALGIKAPSKPIQSAPFPGKAKREAKPSLPPRQIYQ